MDNQSADDQLPIFIKDFPEFTFLENSGNNGFANGCNWGASQSKGEFLFFLNPDTIVTLDALNQLLTTAEANPEVGIFSCMQLDDHGKDTLPYGLALQLDTLTGILRSLYRLTHDKLHELAIKPASKAIFPDWVSGSAIFISRVNFEYLSGWNEDYWMYYEDVDLCKRAREKCGSVALLTNVTIIHNHGGASRVNVPIKILTKSETRISKHVYISKHFSGLKEFFMHAYLITNNLLLGELLIAALGLIFFFIPSLRVYTKLYLVILRYYTGALRNKTWLSPRSVNYKRIY